MKSKYEFVNKYGGWWEGEINSLYAPQMTGKTLFMIDEAYYQMSQGNKVVIIDTEGGLDRMVEQWDAVMRKKHNVSDSRRKIKIVRVRSFEGFMELLGKKVKISSSSGKGKVTVELMKTNVPQIDKYLKQGLLIVDSFTAPFRIAFPSSTSNLPARSDAMGMAIDGLFRVLDRNEDLAVVLLHHASLNPQKPNETKGAVRGGNTVVHFSKLIFYLERIAPNYYTRFPNLQYLRKLDVYRAPNVMPFADYQILKYSDEGVFEVDESAVDEAFGRKDDGE